MEWNRRGLGAALVAGLLLIFSTCSREAPAPADGPADGTGERQASSPYAAYVLLARTPEGSAVAFARVIVDGGEGCPQLVGGPGPLTLSKRLNPHGFEVDVCEGEVPFDQPLRVAGSELTLPAASRRVSRVVVVGDSGCKPKDQEGCGLDDPEWPFPALAAAAATSAPDLVLHVGDYNYRGTPSGFEKVVNGESTKLWYYDAGDGTEPSEQCGKPGPYLSQNSTGNPEADRWEPWWLDFFEPARELLAAAPWIFARGNHELCSHAGPGWFYFLDASSQLAAGGGEQLSCPSQDGGGPALPHLRFVPPQVVPLDDLAVASLDSSNACDELANFAELYRDQLQVLRAQLASREGSGAAWLLGHRPVWGASGTSDGPPFDCDGEPGSGPTGTYEVINRTLQCALDGEEGGGSLEGLDLLLSGHMHRFESLQFAASSARPPQLIVGNSGVKEDTYPPQGAFEQTVDGVAAQGLSVEEFGYLRLEREPAGGWRGAVVTPDPEAWGLPSCPDTEDAGIPLCVEALP